MHPETCMYLNIQSLHSVAFIYHFYNRAYVQSLWNLLPSDTIIATSLETFKHHTTLWIIPLQWLIVNNTCSWTQVDDHQLTKLFFDNQLHFIL